METGIFPNTQEGKNWTVVVFKPPENWVDMLKKFFSFLEGHKECMIPHYTVRASTKNEVIISLRVLRGQQDEGFVRSKITEFLKDCEYSIDPEKGELFSEYYAWIPKRETSAMWTKERCVTLNKMSKFALEIISPNTTEGERPVGTPILKHDGDIQHDQLLSDP